MSVKNSSFYDEIMKEDAYYSEKQASVSDEDCKSMLDAFSTTELETLAAELETAYMKKAAGTSTTIEEKIAEEEAPEEAHEQKEEDRVDQHIEQAADPGDGEEADEEDATESEEAEEAKTKAEKEEAVNPEAKDGEIVATAAEYDEMDLVKVAYEIAEEKLASAGYTLLDYVYSKIPNEKVANFVAENAEKLAFVSNKSSLQTADDLIMNIDRILNSQGE